MKLSTDEIIKKLKEKANPENLGMILVHNGIVRGTSKSGKKVNGMKLTCDSEKLRKTVQELERKEGIEGIEVVINEGNLKVGDTIMIVAVAGSYRSTVIPVFEELLTKLKTEILKEVEI
jgi:molybdopterin synthase catalytic subunit